LHIFPFTDPSTSVIYTLSLHDALPILFQPIHNVLRESFAIEFKQLLQLWRCTLLELVDPVIILAHVACPDRRKSRQFRPNQPARSEEHTSELQSPYDLVCRLLLEKKKE